jgi:uncharacterized protein (TIRG00374 family)
MKQRLLVGIVIGGVFLYLVFRNVDLAEVYEAWENVRYDYLGLAALVLLGGNVIRAYRLGVLLSSLQTIRFARLFEITCVGVSMINILPARLGELTRPYLLARKEGVAVGVSLATIVIERVLDISSLLLLLAVVSAFFSLPDWVIISAWSSFALSTVTMAGLSLLRWKGEAWGKAFGCQKKDKQTLVRRFLEKFFYSFAAGLASSFDHRSLLLASLLSLLLWVLSSLAIHLALLSMNIHLPFYAALTVQIILCLGLILPSAPAFIGSIQFFIVTALSIFSVPSDIALSYALLFHGLVLAVTVGLGLLYFPTLLTAVWLRPEKEKDIGRMHIDTEYVCGSPARLPPAE